jgi:hypothetical protein
MYHRQPTSRYRASYLIGGRNRKRTVSVVRCMIGQVVACSTAEMIDDTLRPFGWPALVYSFCFTMKCPLPSYTDPAVEAVGRHPDRATLRRALITDCRSGTD